MEIRVLRYFLAVAREGSVTGAANLLHVTQPTLSRQLKDLEEELGTKLLVRHSHSVSLTPDGMRLRKRAEEVVDMIESRICRQGRKRWGRYSHRRRRNAGHAARR